MNLAASASGCSQASAPYVIVFESDLAGPDLAGSLEARDRSDARNLGAVDAAHIRTGTALLEVRL